MKQTNLLVQDINGRWEQIGTGTLRGVRPSNVELTGDGWGPKQATFDLTREPWVAWPDIQAYAPIEAWVAGKLTWKGRIVEAPLNDEQRSTTVRCEGMQSHLDDDQYSRFYAHTDLTKWVDARSHLDTDLTRFVANSTVTAGDGQIAIGWGNNATVVDAAFSGVMLDLGQDQEIAYVALDYRKQSGSPGGHLYFYCRAADSPSGFSSGSGYEDAAWASVAGTSWPGSSTRLESAYTGKHRYLSLFVYCPGGQGYTPTDNDGIIIENVEVYSSSLYYDYTTTHASVLDGADIVRSAKAKATVLLDPYTSEIDPNGDAPAQFYMPEYAPDGPRTPRQAIEAVNAFYDFNTKVDERARLIFKPKPTVPAVRVGRWGSSTFSDASAGSAEDVFNKVIVTGQSPTGEQVQTVMRSAQLTGAQFEPIASPSLANPTFDADVNNWTGTTRTYDTATKYAGAGSMRFDRTGGPATFTQPLSVYTSFQAGAYFEPGVTYRLSWWMKGNIAPVRLVARFGNVNLAGGTLDYAKRTDYANDVTTTGWTQVSITWTPTTLQPSDKVSIVLEGQAAYYYWFDSFELSTSSDTIVDKRHFVKAHTLDSGFTLTEASAARLGELYLAAHKSTPFKGSGQAVGSTAVRDYVTGDPVAPEDLLRLTGELMHFEDKIDPDTGAVGRDGRIVSVTYRPDTDTATFDIDNTRSDFDTLLSRVGVKVGQVSR